MAHRGIEPPELSNEFVANSTDGTIELDSLPAHQRVEGPSTTGLLRGKYCLLGLHGLERLLHRRRPRRRHPLHNRDRPPVLLRRDLTIVQHTQMHDTVVDHQARSLQSVTLEPYVMAYSDGGVFHGLERRKSTQELPHVIRLPGIALELRIERIDRVTPNDLRIDGTERRGRSTARAHWAWAGHRARPQGPPPRVDGRRTLLGLAHNLQTPDRRSNTMAKIAYIGAGSRGFAKRGGNALRVPLDEVLVAAEARGIEVLALNEALDALARIDNRKSRVIELRYFGGLSIEETAEVLEVSVDTVKRDFRMARAWLLAELSGKQKPVSP